MNQIRRIKTRIRNRAIAFGSLPNVSETLLKAGTLPGLSHMDALLGQNLAGDGSLDRAILHLERAVQHSPGNDSWQYQLGLAYQRRGSLQEAIERFALAIDLSDQAKYRYHRGRAYEALDRIHEAISDLLIAARTQNADSRTIDALHRLIVKAPMSVSERKRYLVRCAEFEIGGRNWSVEVARLLIEQRLNEETTVWYDRAERAKGLGPEDAYKYGLALNASGKEARAAAMFRRAAEQGSNKRNKYGVASLHASKGNWALAKKFYLEYVPNYSNMADYYYETGMAHDRTYDWPGASKYYLLAIAEDPGHPYWYWRVAFAFERQEMYEDAAEYYLLSAQLRADLDGAYHAGRMYVKAERLERALNCFELCHDFNTDADAPNSLATEAHIPTSLSLENAVTPTVALTLRTNGIQLVRSGQFQRAVPYLSAAVKGLAEHDRLVYAALGWALDRVGDKAGAVEAYLQMARRQCPDGVGRSVKVSHENEKLATYIANRDELAVDEYSILYEVGHGSSISCNPLALYREARRDSRYKSYSHIWVTNPETSVPNDVLNDQRVTIVHRGSESYYKNLATAKYLINNTSFGSYFIKRPEQKYLNTWHGTPFKTLGKSVRGEVLNYGNISRNLLQATHIAVGNRWTADKLLNEHCVEGIYTGEILTRGTPRVDALFAEDEIHDDELKRRLNISSSKPIAVYAPTWRGTLDSVLGSKRASEQDELAISAIRSAGYQVLFSAHRFVHESAILSSGSLDPIPQDVDLYAVLRIADVLITDYSSVWFDYLPMARPIVFYFPDRAEYEQERGLYDVDLPGPVVEKASSLCSTLKAILEAGDEYAVDLRHAVSEYAPNEDGGAAARVLSWFIFGGFGDEVGIVKSPSRLALFRQSFIPNGISASFRALTRELVEKTDIQPYVLLDRGGIISDETRLEQLNLISPHINVLPRAGGMLFTMEERWLERKQVSGPGDLSRNQNTVLNRAYEREFQRIFGCANFELICEFDGYSRYWTKLLSSSPPAAARAIYLHNNMIEEHNTKHPELDFVFPLYRSFDFLVSVSESVNEENIVGISDRYKIRKEKFVWANNVVDVKRVLVSSKEPLSPPHLEFIEGGQELLVVAVGRLSVEKAHDRLIHSFAKIDANIRLVIVGGGPEEDNLRALIDREGVRDRVLVTGHLANPYPIMARANVVTLLSRWEGQGLSLLEAMILGVPTVATDIPGPRSIVGAYGGLLVANTEPGIDFALERISTGNIDAPDIDGEEYNSAAVAGFLSAIAGPFVRGTDR